MEDFKLRIFERENGGRPFPEHRRLGPGEAERWRHALAEKAGARDLRGARLLGILFGRSRPIEGANADSEGFDLAALAPSLGLVPEREVYLNWDDFATIDRVRFADLAEHFPYFWYPGPDDVWIFDGSLRWVLLVDHGGHLRILTPDDG